MSWQKSLAFWCAITAALLYCNSSPLAQTAYRYKDANGQLKSLFEADDGESRCQCADGKTAGVAGNGTFRGHNIHRLPCWRIFPARSAACGPLPQK